MADNGMNELKQKMERYLMETANLISQREYNLALVKSRQAIEQIVRGYAREGRLPYTDLADTIESLYQGRKIERESREACHQIRLLGNKAVHEGDNNPEDAEKSYYLLKKETERYLTQLSAGMNRTPVRVNRDGFSQSARTAKRGGYQSLLDEENDREAGDLLSVGRSGQARREKQTQDPRRSGGSGGRPRANRVPTREDRLRAHKAQQKKSKNQGGLALSELLRILIPVICILLIVVIIRGCMANRTPQETTAASTAPTEQSTEAPTETQPATEPETTAAPVVRYRVTGSAVNARYADNQNRVYEQLAAGTEIGEVQEIEGSDYVRFQRDGIDLVINKNYIEPIEESTGGDPSETAEGGSGSVTAVLNLQE